MLLPTNNAVPPIVETYIGLDLGQRQDHSAIPKLVQEAVSAIPSLPFQNRSIVLTVDAGGPGTPVVDMLRHNHHHRQRRRTA